MVLIDFPHIKHINFKSMKILSSNMPSIHKIYGYGNIAIEEWFNIDTSEKVHNTEEVINEKISITLSVCYKTPWKYYPGCNPIELWPPYSQNTAEAFPTHWHSPIASLFWKWLKLTVLALSKQFNLHSPSTFQCFTPPNRKHRPVYTYIGPGHYGNVLKIQMTHYTNY